LAEGLDIPLGVTVARKKFFESLADSNCTQAMIEYSDVILRSLSGCERLFIDDVELLMAVGGRLSIANLTSESRRVLIAAVEGARCMKSPIIVTLFPRLLRGLAWCELDMGHLPSALEHAKESLTFHEQRSGWTHSDKLPKALRNEATMRECFHQESCHGLIAAVYEEMGCFSEAEESYQRALKIMRLRNGENNSLLNNFAVYLLIIGRYDEAESVLAEAMHAPEERILTKRSCARLNLPELHRKQGMTELALQEIQEVIEVWAGDSAAYAPARAYQVHGDILSDLGRFEEAAAAYDICEEAIHATLGCSERLIGEMLIGVGQNLRRWGRWSEAVEQLEKGTTLLASKITPHPRLAIGMRELSLALMRTERREDAMAMAQGAVKQSLTIFGVHHQECQAALEVLKCIDEGECM
jgi:tetratricopeptide (TPR) repeat protein